MVCNNCDGYGFMVRPPGPIVIQLNDLIKQHPRTGTPMMTVQQAQELIKNISGEVSGFTDRPFPIQCPKCGGHGG